MGAATTGLSRVGTSLWTTKNEKNPIFPWEKMKNPQCRPKRMFHVVERLVL